MVGIIPVSYEKINVGNRLFTIEWDLSPNNSDDVFMGDAFEATDCKLLSICAFNDEGMLCKLYISNFSNAPYGVGVLEPGLSPNFLLPGTGSPILWPDDNSPEIPLARWYFPSAEDVNGRSKITLLFEIIR